MESPTKKRSAPEEQDILDTVKAVLLDIEGTTTPLTFIKETLCGYIKDNVQEYLENHWDATECKTDVEALCEQAKKDKEEKVEGVVEIPAVTEGEEGENDKKDVIDAVVKNVLWQMTTGKPTKSLSQIQGHVWREAYKTGKIQGELFDDIEPALKAWSAKELKVYLFSAGTVDTQKLLFGYSAKGDLQELVKGYFDLTVGGKMEKEAYTKIVEEMDLKPEEVIFFTGVTAEATAAADAGLKTCIVVREDIVLTDEEKKKFNTISSFTELLTDAVDGETPAKKVEKKVEKEVEPEPEAVTA